MNPLPRTVRPPYVRPMKGWWRKNPFFVCYMAREATALIVAAYALFMLAGLLALASGKPAYEAWLACVRSPVSVMLHLIVLAGMVYHSWTWFAIMPKTMPPLLVRGKRVPAHLITLAGVVAAVASSVVLFLVTWSLAS